MLAGTCASTRDSDLHFDQVSSGMRRRIARQPDHHPSERPRRPGRVRRINSPVSGGLDGVQLRVRTTFSHELLVGAGLDQPGPVQDENPVGHAHRGETV